MSGEQLSNALNYLDDDLLLETDELRQGKRTLRRPKVIPWLVPAACLALVLGTWLSPGLKGGSTAAPENGMALFPGDMAMDSAVSESEKYNQQCDCSINEVVQELKHGSISLYIPDDWSYTVEDSQYIVLYHPKRAGTIRVGFDPAFGVCGTGLTEEETVIAGLRACVGTYDGKGVWSYISFLDDYRGYVVINDGADDWCEEAESWLESLKFDPQ